MAKITLNHADAVDVKTSCNLIFTDPPFDMSGSNLAAVFNNINCDHLVLITTMKQFVELIKCSQWELSFDFVIDAVVPKKSKSRHQPNYTHATGAYLTRNTAKSRFDRKRRQRSDTFDNNGYWPSILRAPRQRLQDHGMAKNEKAVTDIMGSFDIRSVYDPFAGSGTTGFAAIELDILCELTELDNARFVSLEKKFSFYK